MFVNDRPNDLFSYTGLSQSKANKRKNESISVHQMRAHCKRLVARAACWPLNLLWDEAKQVVALAKLVSASYTYRSAPDATQTHLSLSDYLSCIRLRAQVIA